MKAIDLQELKKKPTEFSLRILPLLHSVILMELTCGWATLTDLRQDEIDWFMDMGYHVDEDDLSFRVTSVEV